MTKRLSLATACLLAFVAARAALGQINAASSSARLDVVIFRIAGETKVDSQPFAFLLKTGEKGSLTVESTGSADLDAEKSCPVPKTQHVGTQVDATVRPKADDRFSIDLTVTERAFAGCRTVGTVSIPVFSNRIIAKTVTLKSGETTQVDLPTAKMDVTLTMK